MQQFDDLLLVSYIHENCQFCIYHQRLLIALLVPFLAIAGNGGPNRSIYDMADYLHNLNRWTVSDNGDNCQFLQDSVSAWVQAEQFKMHSFDVSIDTRDPLLAWARIEPVRCDFPNGVVTPKPPECEENNVWCENWEQHSLYGITQLFGLRHDFLIEVINENEGVKTTVVYNVKDSVSLS